MQYPWKSRATFGPLGAFWRTERAHVATTAIQHVHSTTLANEEQVSRLGDGIVLLRRYERTKKSL